MGGNGYDPMGEWQGPLPIPPGPNPLMGAAAPVMNPGSAEMGMAGPSFQPRSPNADRMDQLTRQQANPLYRFGSALAGTNPAADEARGLHQMDMQSQQMALQQQQMQQQVQQFMLTKKIAVGTMAQTFLERMANATQDERDTLVKHGGDLLGPLLKEAGWDLPKGFLTEAASTPGLATKLGALVSNYFQDQASHDQIMTELRAVKPGEYHKYVQERWKQAVDGAIPKVMRTITQWSRLVQSNKPLLAQMELLDERGKPKPIPAAWIMQQIDAENSPFKTSADKAAALKVLGTSEHSPFLASQNIIPGTLSEEQMKIVGAAEATASTPKGAAELRTAQAGATTAEATAGVAGRRAAAETTKLEGEAATAAEAARVALAEAKLRVEKLTQETTGGTEQDKRGQADKAAQRYLGMASVRAMQLAQATYGQLKEVVENDATPAGDYAIIVNFAKLLDPDTAAREGEAAAVKSAVSKDSKLREWYDLWVGGKSLTTDQRKDIITRATDVYNGRVKAHEPIAQQFRDYATRNGLNPKDVVVDFGAEIIRKAEDSKPKPRPLTADETRGARPAGR